MSIGHCSTSGKYSAIASIAAGIAIWNRTPGSTTPSARSRLKISYDSIAADEYGSRPPRRTSVTPSSSRNDGNMFRSESQGRSDGIISMPSHRDHTVSFRAPIQYCRSLISPSG